MPTDVNLWQRTLAEFPGDVHSQARERLRVAYHSCRNYSAIIASEIAADQPDYTTHDVTHLDALWEMADIIAGEGYILTPLEAFVLGCAMLIHDLAMTAAAFPSGPVEIIGSERWRDTIYVHLSAELNRQPTTEELDSPAPHIVTAAKRELLRELHAEQAARLPYQEFRDRANDAAYYLIQDPDLRNMYGDIIGRLAASHWWDIGKLAEEFNARLGAPSAMPRDWTVDQLKLACLLRVADASHLDSRRAPGFLRAIRRISDRSRSYWVFQERLNRPGLDGDRLTYTAQQPFEARDSDAWWLCVDALRMVDQQLRGVDALLADYDRPRFAARSVAYVDDLERLSDFIRVRGWYPINASVQVGDVVDLVRKLGGQQLYGDNPRAALRELISNAADAIRARRAVDSPEALRELRLRVQIQLRREGEQAWLCVRDNGIGMSRRVMAGPLLDFGKSFWGSIASRRDFPGLASSGFRPTGTFGIGFFSVFMLGDEVRVTSRQFDTGTSETHVLQFDQGLGGRPLLRPGLREELLPYGGTEVAVKIDHSIVSRIFDSPNMDDEEFTLKDLIAWLCPTIDVNIDVITEQGEVEVAVVADDWMTCPPEELLKRLHTQYSRLDNSIAERLRPVASKDGYILGRAVIPITRENGSYGDSYTDGIVTVGGVRSEEEISRAAGVLIGQTSRAARDSANPVAADEDIAAWASEQASLMSELNITPIQQLEAASIVCALGGNPASLFIAEARQEFLRQSDIEEWASQFDTVYLWQDSAFHNSSMERGNLKDNVLVVDVGYPIIYERLHLQRPDWNVADEDILGWDVVGDRCSKLIFKAWGLSLAECQRQLDEHHEVVRAYEREREYVEDDPDFPFRAEVGITSSGEPFVDNVTILRRCLQLSELSARLAWQGLKRCIGCGVLLASGSVAELAHFEIKATALRAAAPAALAPGVRPNGLALSDHPGF